MLGTLAYIAAPHCNCSSCRSLHAAHLKLKLRVLKATGAFEQSWNDDLSEHDLELLGNAGWPKERVREHVEALQAMMNLLVADRRETQLDE